MPVGVGGGPGVVLRAGGALSGVGVLAGRAGELVLRAVLVGAGDKAESLGLPMAKGGLRGWGAAPCGCNGVGGPPGVGGTLGGPDTPGGNEDLCICSLCWNASLNGLLS